MSALPLRPMSADRMILTALLVVGLSACGTSEPSADSTGGEPTPSAATASLCRTLDLRTPSGIRLDLTGTWRADIVTRPGAISAHIVRYVRQFGDCIWWQEMDAEPGRPAGEIYRRLFFGSLEPNFTVVGQFGDVFYVQAFDTAGEFVVPKFGPAVWKVDITTSGDEEVIALLGPSRGIDVTGPPATWVFSRVDTSTAR